MARAKRPRKPKNPARSKRAAAAAPSERQTRTKAELVPPSRRPPTAVGVDLPERHRPALSRVLQLLRTAVGAMLDIADAAADAITKGREGRA